MPSTLPEHLSIGEVLATLRQEFPDITISKIRFLESQGLIDPERTPSGYRKFYAHDVARLRWILHQQKEHFLPLKVIKDRLDEGAADEPASAPPRRARTRARGGAASAPSGAGAAKPTSRGRRVPPAMPELPLDEGGADDELDVGPSGASLTRAELASAAGLTDGQLTDLEEYGLLEPAIAAGERGLFDEQALTVAGLAARFAARGVDARHLRMYHTFAQREAALFAQVVLPLLRQRNPEARARARADLVELARLGRGLRTAYLRRALAELLSE